MTIEVACLDPNPHELLVHDIATRVGSYKRHGVAVQLVDAPGGAGLVAPASFGLGGTLLQRAREGTPWTVVSVNTDRPLFWLVAMSPDVAADLEGRRLVGWPATVAPMLMLRAVLEEDGVELDTLHLEPVVPGPGADARRLDAVVSGEADVALLGSQIPPLLVEERAAPLLWLGARVRIPTTGIAVNAESISPEDPEVLAVVAAQREALDVILHDDDVVLTSLASLFADGAYDHHRDFSERYIRTSFGRAPNDGDRSLWRATAERLCRYRGVATPDLSDFYRI